MGVREPEHDKPWSFSLDRFLLGSFFFAPRQECGFRLRRFMDNYNILINELMAIMSLMHVDFRGAEEVLDNEGHKGMMHIHDGKLLKVSESLKERV